METQEGFRSGGLPLFCIGRKEHAAGGLDLRMDDTQEEQDDQSLEDDDEHMEHEDEYAPPSTDLIPETIPENTFDPNVEWW